MADQENVTAIARVKSSPLGKDGEINPFLGQEFGVGITLPFASWGAEGEVVRLEKISLDDLVEMRRFDGQASALMRLFILPILAAFKDSHWVEPEDGDAEEETEYANQMFNLPPSAGGMLTPKTAVLKHLLRGLSDGFAVFEENRTVPKDGPLKGKIVIEELAFRDPTTLSFMVDPKGRYEGVRQVSNMGGVYTDVRIDKSKLFRWTYQEEENPLYGISILESAYEHYKIKRKLYFIAHLAAQFAAVPGRVGTIPKTATPAQITAFQKAIQNFAFNTAMTAPEGFDVKPFQGHTGFDFIKLIDHHNHMMSKSVLAAFLDSEARATLIEIGRTDPNTDFFVMALEAIMNDIAEHLTNDLMPKYIDWNFGTKKYPVFKFGALSDSSKSMIQSLFQSVVTSSVLNSTPELVRELEKSLAKEYGLDIDYEEIEEQEKKVAEEQAAAQQEEHDAFMQGGVPPGQEQPAEGEEGPLPSLDNVKDFDPKDKELALSNTERAIDDLIASAVDLLEARPEEHFDV